MSGHVVAQHHDDVRMKRIGAFDDGFDAFQRHPGVAGMKVGDDGYLELETGGPLRRRDVIPRNAKPQQGSMPNPYAVLEALKAPSPAMNERTDGVKS